MDANTTIHQANLAKWNNLFLEQKSSGLTIKEWCSRNDVSIHAYYYWKRIAKEEYVKSFIPDIVPLPVSADPIPDTFSTVESSQAEHELYNLCNFSEPLSLNSAISISTRDIRMEIGPSISDALVSKIIGVLRHA